MSNMHQPVVNPAVSVSMTDTVVDLVRASQPPPSPDGAPVDIAALRRTASEMVFGMYPEAKTASVIVNLGEDCPPARIVLTRPARLVGAWLSLGVLVHPLADFVVFF